MIKLLICVYPVLFLLYHVHAQYEFSEHKVENIVWCTKSLEEQYKCGNLTKAIERDRVFFDDLFVNLSCFRAYSPDECISHIDREEAHITTLDAGDIFMAGRYHSLIPITKEKYEGGFTNYYSVAVMKKNDVPEVTSIRDLRNKKACFPWVGSLAGWIIPIYTLQREGGMEVVDCNNQVKTAANFFNDSCAVYSLIDKYNPIGDNSDKLCTLCAGRVQDGRCTPSDPYFGYNGAFRCLLESGNVAFLRHTTVADMIATPEFDTVKADRFELLCTDGRRAPLTEYLQCNWGLVPSDAIVTSSARTFSERTLYQRFLNRVTELYSEGIKNETDSVNSKDRNYFNDQQQQRNRNLNQQNNIGMRDNRIYNPYSDNPYEQNPYVGSRRQRQVDPGFYTSTDRNSLDKTNRPVLIEHFGIFESKKHGKPNLLFQDTTKSLISIEEDDQLFSKYLESSMHYIYGMRECPIGRMTLCITSDAEWEKCLKMRTALKAHILKPELLCYKAHSQINCMQSIQTGRADVTVLDAGDVYTAGLNYNLIPIMSEVYNLGEPEYYVVAVAKEEDPDTDLTYLKGKYTCHTGINMAAGWTYPMAYLISNGWIRPYGCDSVRAAAEYFTKSCIPGAISSEYNTGVPYDSMCQLCHGSSYRYCRRDASEDYYGHTGAFRCLVEGGGQVAFIKHTTVMESTGGKRSEWWARNTLNDDFELLCTDGTRAKLNEYERCNLGKVKANAIVTRGGNGYNETELNAFINLFMYAQQLYGRKDVDTFSFSMFSSSAPFYDLIFQDATRQLQVIKPEKRSYDLYLGRNYMRARRITDCSAGSNKLHISIYLISILLSIIIGVK